MKDTIYREDAIEAVMAESRKVYTSEYANAERIIYEADAVEALAMCPSAEAVEAIHDIEWVGIRRDEYEDFLASAEAVQGWNNHEIACMLADLFKDPCACNQCCIDEWLPYKCDLDCGNVVGVACWEQFVKHYREHKGGDE